MQIILNDYARVATTGNSSVEISPKEFIEQLKSLNVSPEIEFYTREKRGHLRFTLPDGRKLSVSVSKAAIQSKGGTLFAPATETTKDGDVITTNYNPTSKNPMDYLTWAMKNLVLRAGVGTTQSNFDGDRKFLSFGVRGESGNLIKGTIDLKAFIEAYAG